MDEDIALADILDNLGLRVRIAWPVPEPKPGVIERLRVMYGCDREDPDHERDRRRQEAARRTAVAMERRRQGWTREGAMADFRRRVLGELQTATSPAAEHWAHG